MRRCRHELYLIITLRIKKERMMNGVFGIWPSTRVGEFCKMFEVIVKELDNKYAIRKKFFHGL